MPENTRRALTAGNFSPGRGALVDYYDQRMT